MVLIMWGCETGLFIVTKVWGRGEGIAIRACSARSMAATVCGLVSFPIGWLGGAPRLLGRTVSSQLGRKLGLVSVRLLSELLVVGFTVTLFSLLVVSWLLVLML